MDRWDGETLVRTIRTGDRCIAYAARPSGSCASPVFAAAVEKSGEPAVVEALAVRAVQNLFVQPPAEFHELAQADPVIGRLNGLYPALRPVRQPDLLQALVRHVSAQQVNLKWAVTTRRRLSEQIGTRHQVAGYFVYSLDAARLAAAGVEAIRALQFTTRKAECLVGIGEAFASGALSTAELASLTDEEVIERLVRLKGIGLWTAEWILARTLDRPRVVAGDLAVRKAIGLAYLNDPLPSEAAARQAVTHWGPSALQAQALLLHAWSSGTLAG